MAKDADVEGGHGEQEQQRHYSREPQEGGNGTLEDLKEALVDALESSGALGTRSLPSTPAHADAALLLLSIFPSNQGR
jgi:hypothetical protein